MKILLCLFLIFSIVFPDIAVSKVNGRDRNRTALSRRMVREGSKDLSGGEMKMDKPGSIFKKIEKDVPGAVPNNPSVPGPTPPAPPPITPPSPPTPPTPPVVPSVPLTPLEAPKSEKLAELSRNLKSVFETLNGDIALVKSACVGISKKLDEIYKLSASTAGLSAGTTALAGGALIAGAVKSNKKGVADALKEQNVGEDVVKDNLKSAKTANNWRTGLLATSIATSGAAVGTSGASVYHADKLPDTIKNCNEAIKKVNVDVGNLKAEIKETKDRVIEITTGKTFSNTKSVVANIDEAEKRLKVGEGVKENCEQYDKQVVNFVKGLSISSTTLTSVGTATGLVGAFTSGFAKDGHKNEKKLDITSNVMAGITAGTGVAAMATSADTAKKAKDLKEKSDKCETYLNGIN